MKLLHREAFTHRNFYTEQACVSREAFFTEDFYTQKLLRRVGFPQSTRMQHREPVITDVFYNPVTHSKLCTKCVLKCTCQPIPTFSYYKVLASSSRPSHYFVLRVLAKLAHSIGPSTTSVSTKLPGHKANVRQVLLCITEGNAQSTSQATSLAYILCTLQSLHNTHVPGWLQLCTTKLAQSTIPVTSLYYKVLHQSHVPVLLCTTKLAQSTVRQYYFVRTKLAQSTSHVLLCNYNRTTHKARPQYYFVLQDLHKARPSTDLCTHKACTNARFWSTTLYYKA